MSNNNQQPVVLIIDDNLTNLKILMDSLSESGLKVIISEDGESGIRRAIRVKPDVILLDIMMPGIDGFETCDRLKANNITKDIPVIFMTALNNTVDIIRGFRVGAVDYITKPYQQEEVMVRIQTHLTIQNQQKELARLNNQLSEVNQNLIQSNAEKDRFMSIISHDLRGVFNPLLISIDVLIKLINKSGQLQLIDFAENVLKSANNAYKLLENLLTWSKIQREGMTLHAGQLSLYNIVNETISLLEENARIKKIALNNTLSENCSAYADGNMIQTIIRNLISNAIKFTHPGGRIDIFETCESDSIKLSIKDSGVGIRDTDLDKLFRIDKKFKEKGTAGEIGTGLGLILCKDLIEKNNGSISVTSTVNLGSTFTIVIPKEKRIK